MDCPNCECTGSILCHLDRRAWRYHKNGGVMAHASPQVADMILTCERKAGYNADYAVIVNFRYQNYQYRRHF